MRSAASRRRTSLPDAPDCISEPGTYRIDAASVINDTAGSSFAGAHSDIKKLPVAQLAAAAAAAHA